jgi:transcriptional regulator with XRE-family HTH domain
MRNRTKTSSRSLPIHAQRLGYNISRLRQLRNCSQELLAHKLNITARYLQKIEAGSNVPSLSLLVKLRKTLRASWERLFRDM